MVLERANRAAHVTPMLGWSGPVPFRSGPSAAASTVSAPLATTSCKSNPIMHYASGVRDATIRGAHGAVRCSPESRFYRHRAPMRAHERCGVQPSPVYIFDLHGHTHGEHGRAIMEARARSLGLERAAGDKGRCMLHNHGRTGPRSCLRGLRHPLFRGGVLAALGASAPRPAGQGGRCDVPEAVLEPAGDFLEVAHAARAGRLSALGLLAPLVRAQLRGRVPALRALYSSR
jgi:hypothetical protein